MSHAGLSSSLMKLLVTGRPADFGEEAGRPGVMPNGVEMGGTAVARRGRIFAGFINSALVGVCTSGLLGVFPRPHHWALGLTCAVGVTAVMMAMWFWLDRRSAS